MSRRAPRPPGGAGASAPLPRPEGALVPAEPYERGVAWLATLGHDTERLLAQAGIPPERLRDPGARLTLAQVEALVLVAAERVNEPGRALELGGRLTFPAFGDVGFAALTAPTAADAMGVAARYFELISPLFVLEQAIVPGFLHVHLRPAYRLHDTVLVVHIQVILSTLHALVSAALDRVPEGIEVAIPVQDSDLLAWLRSRRVAVRPGFDAMALWIPEHVARAPLLLANAEAHAGFVARCEALLADRRTQSPMTRDVRRALAGAGPDLRDLGALAPLLGVPPETILRELEREGTTFHQLLTEARFAWAAAELAETTRSVTELSYELGYSTPANFTRAFTRAFGVSPTAYRRRAALERAR